MIGIIAARVFESLALDGFVGVFVVGSCQRARARTLALCRLRTRR